MERLFILYTLLILPGLVGILRGLFQNVYLWQVKEYRLDRFLSHFRFEKDYSKIGVILWLTKIALFIVGSLYLFFPGAKYLIFTFVIIFVLYFLHFEWFLLDLVKNRLVRPGFRSSRNIMILSVVLVINFLLYGRILWWLMQFDYSNIDLSASSTSIVEVIEHFGGKGDSTAEGAETIPLFTLVAALAFLGTLAVDLLVPIWVSIMVVVTSPISRITRARTISKAKQIILDRGDNLKVIAITGSFGKTTTKEMIYHILSSKFQTAKTIANQNTAVGIAQSVISQVKSDTEIFVAEMGAYKLGEIREATAVVSPDIALVTALSQQHLSLFGSKENLFNAKFELIDGLKLNGTAVFNGNDENCVKMAMKTDRKKVFFYQLPTSHGTSSDGRDIQGVENTVDQNSSNENLYLNNVVDIGESLEVEVTYKDQKFFFVAPLKETSYTLNLLGAMSVCLQAGMKIEEVIEAVGTLPNENGYLSSSRGINNSLLIEDGKTSNLVGFQTALSFLDKKAKGKKWVMTQGILDLGEERTEVYKTLATDICQKANGLITNDKDLANTVKSTAPDFPVIKVEAIHEFYTAYNLNIKQSDTVLLEGTFPREVVNKIKQNGD